MSATPLTDAQREQKKWDAWNKSIEGSTRADIAAQLGITISMVRTLLGEARDEYAQVRLEEGANEIEDLAAGFDRDIREAYQRLTTFPKGKDSLAVPALLTSIGQARERKGRLLGYYARRLEVGGSLPVTVTLQFDRSERSELPPPQSMLADHSDVIDAEVVE